MLEVAGGILVAIVALLFLGTIVRAAFLAAAALAGISAVAGISWAISTGVVGEGAAVVAMMVLGLAGVAFWMGRQLDARS